AGKRTAAIAAREKRAPGILNPWETRGSMRGPPGRKRWAWRAGTWATLRWIRKRPDGWWFPWSRTRRIDRLGGSSKRRRRGSRMRRTGRAVGTGLAVLLSSGAALAEVEFYQRADRAEVGLDDTFRLTIVVSDAPDSADPQFPTTSDFQVLSKSQSSQTSFQLGGGSGILKR